MEGQTNQPSAIAVDRDRLAEIRCQLEQISGLLITAEYEGILNDDLIYTLLRRIRHGVAEYNTAQRSKQQQIP